MSLQEIPLGAIRFNSDSQKLEYFNGEIWMQVHTFNPDLDGGARGMFGGGWVNSPSTVYTNAIDYITISTAGNAVTFGDLLGKTSYLGAVASRTRGVYVGGNSPEASPVTQNVMQYVTISSTGDTINFGDLTEKIAAMCGHSNETRAVVGSGFNPSPAYHSVDTINHFTIASTGNAQDFGNLPQTRSQCFTFGNPTRAIWGGGYYTNNGASGGTQTLVVLQLATTGTAFEFGKLRSGASQEIRRAGLSNSIRGLAAGGNGSEYKNDIDSLNIASLGNMVNFGDLLGAVEFMGGVSSPTRGVFAGGNSGPYSVNNIIQYVTIATEGNAVDFGDLVDDTRSAYPRGVSNAHGGL